MCMQYDRLLHHTQKCLRIICHALIVVVHSHAAFHGSLNGSALLLEVRKPPVCSVYSMMGLQCVCSVP